VVHVIDPRAIVDAIAGDREPTPDEFVEKGVALLATVGDAGEGGVLPFETQTGMPHHEHQKPRLALRETVVGCRLDAFCRRHSSISSASPP
jgi:hypothetical protein